MLKALVYGLARPGGGGAARRARRRLGARRSLARERGRSLVARRCRVLVKSPGVPPARRRSSPRRASGGSRSGRRSSSAIACFPARSSSASPARTARRPPRSCSARSSAPRVATSRSPGTWARRSRRCARRTGSCASCPRSSSRTSRLRLRRRGAAQPRTRPLDRHGTFEAYREAKLRIFERSRARVVPRGLGLAGIEFSADDELPAEPLIRGAHNRENAAAATAAARAAGIADGHCRPRCSAFRACRIASSSSASATAFATSTTPRRRMSRRRSVHWRRTRTNRCT